MKSTDKTNSDLNDNKPCPLCDSPATEESTIFCLNADDVRVRCSSDTCLLRVPVFTKEDWNNETLRGES